MKDITPAITATIKDGCINLDDKVLFKKTLESLNGKKVKIKFTRFRKNRSNDQNEYYWGVIIKMIADESGYITNDEYYSVHCQLKGMFLPKYGKLNISSSANLNTAEFEEYQSKIRVWASSFLNLYIPKPNQI